MALYWRLLQRSPRRMTGSGDVPRLISSNHMAWACTKYALTTHANTSVTSSRRRPVGAIASATGAASRGGSMSAGGAVDFSRYPRVIDQSPEGL